MFIVYLLGGTAFFALCIAFVGFADHLREGGS
ncbi:hypothetical protein AEYBE204_03570 [Asticcacaulis sp. YBE204]|nr:hypothetical protein AEYBE204_03570 [Asticcacaulis sp. YBE204]